MKKKKVLYWKIKSQHLMMVGKRALLQSHLILLPKNRKQFKTLVRLVYNLHFP